MAEPVLTLLQEMNTNYVYVVEERLAETLTSYKQTGEGEFIRRTHTRCVWDGGGERKKGEKVGREGGEGKKGEEGGWEGREREGVGENKERMRYTV